MTKRGPSTWSGDAAESIVNWLCFMVDLPSKHKSGKVPMLDLEVWVHKGDEGPDVLCWDFFEKPSSSTRVLKASSAYSWRAKLTVMNMEVFRRLRNTSRQVTLDRRVEILNKVRSQAETERLCYRRWLTRSLRMGQGSTIEDSVLI